jgi:two-component system, OmpR family, response regulator BaeR
VTNKHILIIEDEVKIASLLDDYLRASYFTTSVFHDGTYVVNWVKQNRVDLILLDLMLPGKDGMDVCREIRRFSNIPIIIITAKIEEIDRILGLEIGADDYICKPFSPREVVARVKVIFRRMEFDNSHDEYSESPLKLNSDKFEAIYQETKLDLTPVEFSLLFTLHERPGRVFSRDQLMTLSYNDNRIVSDRTIDSHIKNLRKKLQNAGAVQESIHSVYGVGYKYEHYD